MNEDTNLTRRVVFVCLHGSAKSLIAAEHLNRLAESQGLRVRGESAGLEPDADVPPGVVAGLGRDGFAVDLYRPRQLTPDMLEQAALVVLCGCDLPASVPSAARVERWDDLPLVSDGYDTARTAILDRLTRLIVLLEERDESQK